MFCLNKLRRALHAGAQFRLVEFACLLGHVLCPQEITALKRLRPVLRPLATERT